MTAASSSGFDERERQLMREAAQAVVARRLAVPVMMALETLVPMNVLTASMLDVLAPAWKAALPASRIDAVARLLERRDALPEFVRLLDELESARRREQRQDRAARKAARQAAATGRVARPGSAPR